MVGKLPHEVLVSRVFTRTGVRDPDVVVGPGVAVDAAVIRIGDRYLVVHTDPITEAVERAGWLAVHIASNDVAVAGGRPRWASIAVLLPPGGSNALDTIMADVDRAARELGLMVVGGHTEEAPGVSKPTVVATVMGVADRVLDIRRVGPGMEVVVAKYVGGEGTAIIASDFADILRQRGVDETVLAEARGFFDSVSVVREALEVADIATAMHDPTEGGLLGALYEVAYATRTVIELWPGRVPVHPVTRTISRVLGIDPLRLISSGTLIVFAEKDVVDEVVGRLSRLGVPVAHVGRVVEHSDKPMVRLVEDGRVTGVVDGFVVDEIARLWEEREKLERGR